MGNRLIFLSKPVLEPLTEEGSGDNFIYSAVTIQGWRKEQEDRFSVVTNIVDGCSFFGVYDGHGGYEVAEYLRNNLHSFIVEQLENSDDVELSLYLGFLTCDLSIMDPEGVFEMNKMLDNEDRKSVTNQAVHTLTGTSSSVTKSDEPLIGEVSSSLVGQPGPSQESTDLDESTSDSDGQTSDLREPNPKRMKVETPLHYLLNQKLDSSDTEDADYNVEDDENDSSSPSESMVDFLTPLLKSEPGEYSGSTGTVALVYKSKVYIANAGDSRCVLSHHGEAIDMTIDHKPEDLGEFIRITGGGMAVSSDGRINDVLNLSRAFGDFKFKGNSEIPALQCVSVEPNVKSSCIENGDFLVIASDGLWNAMTSQDVVDFIALRNPDNEKDLTEVCEELLHLTVAPTLNEDGTGMDNISLIIVKF